jgi:hypothetical protein
MSKFDGVIKSVDAVIADLKNLRKSLKEMKDDSEAVEKARDVLRRRRPPKNGPPD